MWNYPTRSSAVAGNPTRPMPGVGQIGYVAAGYRTRIGECYSAGRLYDKFEDNAYGRVLYVLDDGVVCEFEKEDDEISL